MSRSDLFGFRPVPISGSSLHGVDFSNRNIEQIIAAQVLVFPSPFSITSSFQRCIELRSKPVQSSVVIAVIGLGSHRALAQEIASAGWQQNQFDIVANLVEPFDAEHLAKKLRQYIEKNPHGSDKPPITSLDKGVNVVLLQGDKSSNDAKIWEAWLNADSRSAQVAVSEVQAYENREDQSYEQTILKSQPNSWCTSNSAVYFSSSASVRHFAKAFRSTSTLQGQPTALTIHPKISHEVQLHLGWEIVELGVGPQPLLHWMSQNAAQL